MDADPKARERRVRFLTRLTTLRIVLVPVVMGCVLVGERVRYAYVAGAVLFAVAAATDFLDGRLARSWGAATDLGSFLDTTADKLLVSGTLVALVAAGRASPWIAAIVVGREFVILALRGLVATEGSVIKPSVWGKLKFGVQAVAITMAAARHPVRVGPLFADEWVMLAAAAITVVSGAEYLARFWSALSATARRS